MKSCGIIVEYNPFHNGHQYHAQQARLLSNADVVIAIMSGNFLQRGEPAILDKWTRAEEALSNGVDLVIELPFAYAVQAADYFAAGAIQLLHAVGCDALCFGTDHEATLSYETFGQFVQANQAQIDAAYQSIKNNGQSYPQQMTTVLRQLYPDFSLDTSSPNHILGMSYAKENTRYEKPMKLFPIQRKQAGYHDLELYSSIASATAIRKTVFSKEVDSLSDVLPTKSLRDLRSKPLISWENYWPLLKYQLLTSSLAELKEMYQMKEGIEYRLKEAAKTANSFKMFLELAKTKRYTWTRLQRLAVYILANSTQAEIMDVWQASYLHVLGFNKTGQRFLKEKRKTAKLPVITKVAKNNAAMLGVDIKVDQLYQLGNQAIEEQSFGRIPIQVSEH